MQALLVQEWLHESQSQLTYHGLYELHANMKPNQLGVCFRNNHFSVVFKHEEALYLLVTDQGAVFGFQGRTLHSRRAIGIHDVV